MSKRRERLCQQATWPSRPADAQPVTSFNRAVVPGESGIFGIVMSRAGIEPATRSLKGCCSTN